jgi:methionine sulfoxide reductase catalytic subunit
MLYRRRRGWELPESTVTPEHLFFSRRQALGLGAGALLAASVRPALAAGQAETDALHPYPRNPAFTIEGDVTPEKLSGNYNNFYEFGTSKSVASAAQALKVRPWVLKIDGMVETPREVGIDDLMLAMPREERLYRHRCVETWSMTVPWSGFPLRALLDFARPLASAKYVRFETFHDPKMAPGQKAPFYPWPYVEGLTIAEAANDLAFMVTGVYGKPLPKQFGAPLRLALPWKYGFKSIKSIARISFTDKRPVGLWEALQASEYGFWANVNPKVSHPRWSQASETPLGTTGRIPTRLFNGYAAEVADLYKGLENEKLWA